MITKKKFVALILAFVTLGCWGVLSARADDLGLGYYQQGGANLDGPSYAWWYGCSPTSAGMMMGYYDQKGYGGLSYGNLVSGGTAEGPTFPLTSPWNALVKTTIASQQYVDDYYRYANSTPDLTNGGNNSGLGIQGDDATTNLHTPNCLADYMGSGQDWANSSNGSTWFWYVTGGKYYAKDAYAEGHYLVRNGIMEGIDGMLGMDLYFRSRGYGTGNIADDMNFYTWALSTSKHDQGCTFSDYKALIDAGLVVMIQIYRDGVGGHSMFGFGYTVDGVGNDYINFYDTWDDSMQTMLWGGAFSNMDQWGITVFDPTGGSPVPLPSTLLLLASGLAGMAGLRRRFGKR